MTVNIGSSKTKQSINIFIKIKTARLEFFVRGKSRKDQENMPKIGIRESKTIEIQEVLLWIERHVSPSSALEALEGWLESKMWEPEIGEVCEFSDYESFPDNETSVGYFLGTDNGLFQRSIYKNARIHAHYSYMRPIKGGGE